MNILTSRDWYKALGKPSIFLASPGDLSYLRKSVQREFESLQAAVADDRGIELYAWELEYSESGFEHWLPAQRQIPTPSDELCCAVICMFGERIGTPLDDDFPLGLLGDEARRQSPDGYRLCHPWKTGKEGEGCFPLTGSIFEVLTVLARNEGKAVTDKLPFHVVLFGEDDIFATTNPLDAGWGCGKLYDKALDSYGRNRSGFRNWLDQEYEPQLKQLWNFLQYLRYRGIPLGMPVSDEDTALAEIRGFLERNLDYGDPAQPVDPFKGLEFYDEADSQAFFGRTQLRKNALKRFSELWDEADSRPFFGLYGRSGSGKSSFLRAGLIAHLKSHASYGDYKGLVVTAADLWVPPEDHAQRGDAHDPLILLFDQVSRIVLEDVVEPWRLLEYQADAQPVQAVAALVKALDLCSNDDTEQWRLVIGLDQFEELMDYRANRSLSPRLDSLFNFFDLATQTGRIGFIFTSQNNRAELVDSDPILSRFMTPNAETKVPLPSAECFEEIVTKSIQITGMPIPQTEIRAILDQIDGFANQSHSGGGSLLPLIALYLRRIYEFCAGHETLTGNAQIPVEADSGRGAPIDKQSHSDALKELLRSEGIEGAIKYLAEKALAEAREHHGLVEEAAEINTLLRRLLHIQDAAAERLGLAAAYLPEKGGVRIIADVLIKYRLLLRVDDRQVRLVHEAVINHWPPAQQWLQDERELLRTEAQTRFGARDWQESGRASVALKDIGADGVAEAARLLAFWPSKYFPQDGTSVMPGDALIRDYCFAQLDRNMQPAAVVASPYGSTHHFLIAATYGRTELVRKFLEVDAQAIELERDDGMNAAYAAAFNDSAELMALILDAGADPSACNDDNWRPVHVAANSSCFEALKCLAGAGANLGDAGSGCWTPMHFACQNDFPDMVEFLLERHDVDPDISNDHDWRPFHLACRYGGPEVVGLMLGSKQVDVSTAVKGWTPIHLAVTNDNSATVSTLLADLRLDCDVLTPAGHTPVHMAIHNNNRNSLSALLEHPERIDVNARDDKDRTPVLFAVETGNNGVLRELLEAGAAVDLGAADGGLSPLATGVNVGDMVAVSMLLEHGADPNALCKVHQPLLYIAASSGNTELVDILLESGADPNSKTASSSTPLMVAVERGHIDCAKRILAHDADVKATDTDGMTALMLAARANEVELGKLLVEHGASVDEDGLMAMFHAIEKGAAGFVVLLHELGVDINAAGLLGETPLHRAASVADAKLVELFIERGTRVYATDGAGWSPLHVAAQTGTVDIVRILLDRGADPHKLSDSPTMTLLQIAAEVGNDEAVRMLVEHGCDLEAVTRHRPTAMILARRNAQHGTVDILTEAGANPDAADKPAVPSAFPVLARYHPREAIELIQTILDQGGKPPEDVRIVLDKSGKVIQVEALEPYWSLSIEFRNARRLDNWTVIRSDKPVLGYLDPAIRNVVFARDMHVCRCCGFRSTKYQSLLLLGSNARDLNQMMTLCIFCNQYFDLNSVSEQRSGVLIRLPEVPVPELHHLMRDIYVARIRNWPEARIAQKLLAWLLERRKEAVKCLGTDDPAVLAEMLTEHKADGRYPDLHERLDGIRLLPLDRRIIREADLQYNQFPQILAFWRSKNGPLNIQSLSLEWLHRYASVLLGETEILS